MPTNDDTPKIESLVGDSLLAAEVSANNKLSRSDLVQIYDVSAGKLKSITVQELGEALGVTFS